MFYEWLNIHQLFITQVSCTDKTCALILSILYLFILWVTPFQCKEILSQVCNSCEIKLAGLDPHYLR